MLFYYLRFLILYDFYTCLSLSKNYEIGTFDSSGDKKDFHLMIKFQ